MSTADKTSLINSILQSKCPKCRKGAMFLKGTIFHPSRFSVMNRNCESCSFPFEPEPGYYFGAMFVSYAINTVIFITVWLLISIVYPLYTTLHLVSILILVSLGFLPFIYRISRTIWLSIFVKFDEQNGDYEDIKNK